MKIPTYMAFGLLMAAVVLCNESRFSQAKTKPGILQSLKQQIKEKEAEIEDAERINKNFERMIQLVNILGQIDTFLTDRTRLLFKKLARLVDDDVKTQGRRPDDDY